MDVVVIMTLLLSLNASLTAHYPAPPTSSIYLLLYFSAYLTQTGSTSQHGGVYYSFLAATALGIRHGYFLDGGGGRLRARRRRATSSEATGGINGCKFSETIALDELFMYIKEY
jgi:hypothetical protein